MTFLERLLDDDREPDDDELMAELGEMVILRVSD